MEFQEFLEKQKGIYSKFRDTSKLKSEGTSPSIPNYQGGCLIGFRHPKDTAVKVEKFSQNVDGAIGSLVYRTENVHTTISDMNVSEDFRVNRTTLDNLANLISESKEKIQVPTIDYGEWLANQNTVIAGGIPNEAFLNTSQYLVEEANRRGINLRLPWGAHITSGRFKEQTKSVDKLLTLLSSQPLGKSTPFAIDVGYFDFSPEGFEYKTHERFEF